MKIESDNPWPVTKFSVQSADPDGVCFYCKAEIGQQHESLCVVRERTVVVDVTFRLVSGVPEYWSPRQVEYRMKHGRLCADNILHELNSLAEHTECLCDFFKGRYVREATAEDEETFGVRVEQMPMQQPDAAQD